MKNSDTMAPAESLEHELQKQLNEKLGALDIPKNLADSIRYSLLAPGKRIRPRLLLTAGKLLELPQEATVRAAIALEMIHCFTLIHDDLPCMDNDDFRRGRPSNHKVFGESVALLAGDTLIPMAFDLIAETSEWVPPARALGAIRKLADAVGPRGVCGGQAAEALLGDHSKLADLNQMHAQKTGALFEASLTLPKELAGISDFSAEGQALIAFGKGLGLAFQIQDDLEDAAEEKATDGTYPPTQILRYLSPQEARELATSQLASACAELSRIWGGRATQLIQIADEILLRLRG